MQTLHASLRARSQTMWRATAMPSTQNGAEPSALTNSSLLPARAIARAPATIRQPATLTAVGCRRSSERSAPTRARIKWADPFLPSLSRIDDPYTGSDPFARRPFSLCPSRELHPRGSGRRMNDGDGERDIGAGGRGLDLRPLRGDGELLPRGRGAPPAIDLVEGERRALLPRLPARDGRRCRGRTPRRGRLPGPS